MLFGYSFVSTNLYEYIWIFIGNKFLTQIYSDIHLYKILDTPIQNVLTEVKRISLAWTVVF